MSEDSTVDPGLEELVSDVLGPRADASADAATQAADDTSSAQPVAQDSASEPAPAPPATQPTAQTTPPVASAPAPTQPQAAAEPTVELDFGDGRGPQKFTRDQLVQTLRQFPHLQQKYVEAKQRAESYEAKAKEEQAKRQADPQTVLQAIRGSFDPGVRESVSHGFMEEEFATLYPNLAASMIMHRDLVAALVGRVNEVTGKVGTYEQQVEGQRVRQGIENSMVALSGTHPAYAELADAGTRAKFYDFIWNLNPTEDQFQNPRYIASCWAAFNEPRFLASFTTPAAAAPPAADPKARARTRAFAAGEGGHSRPAPPPPAERPAGAAGDDMFDEALAALKK